MLTYRDAIAWLIVYRYGVAIAMIPKSPTPFVI